MGFSMRIKKIIKIMLFFQEWHYPLNILVQNISDTEK